MKKVEVSYLLNTTIAIAIANFIIRRTSYQPPPILLSYRRNYALAIRSSHQTCYTKLRQSYSGFSSEDDKAAGEETTYYNYNYNHSAEARLEA